jgi:hypothetical protein
MSVQLRRLKLQLLSAVFVSSLGAAGAAYADGPSFEIFGHAMADYVQDFNRVDPNWDDTLRPSKIPTTPGQFGSDGQSIISVRQSRFGAKMNQDIAGQPLMVQFDFDLYGSGANEGETTFHLQHFYGSWGPILAGRNDSNFMDGSIFPNTIDFWGPPGMVYIRTPQIRFTYKTGKHEIAVAVEKPSNDIDPGNIRIIDPSLAGNIQGDEKIPDFTAHWRYEDSWGHVQLAGILRRVGYETIGTTDNRPKGSKLGWGIDATSNIKVWKKDVLHLGVVYGEGIASYMNDGGTDLAPVALLAPAPPIFPPPAPVLQPGVVPLLGITVYYDHYWNDQWSTSIGYGQTRVDNTNFQAVDAFRSGQYASANILFTPDSHLMMGAEFLWGQREDHDRANGHDTRLQFSVKYSFSSKDFFK